MSPGLEAVALFVVSLVGLCLFAGAVLTLILAFEQWMRK